MVEPRAPRGMHDLLPEAEPLWRYVRDTAERVAQLFDYHMIGTPLVEDAAVFLRTVGDESDIISKEMYLFDDRGGDHLALRPEGTAAVCRAYLEHGMASRPQPVRLFYFGPMFRYDRPQAGRYRQLWQFGVECIGDPAPAADVEVIELQRTLYEQLGLLGAGGADVTLRINSIGTAETRHRYIEALHAHFLPHAATLSRDSQRRLDTNVLRVLDSKEDAGHPAVASAPSILDYLDEGDAAHFAEVRALLDALGVRYEVDPRIVRGLDYYARTVWEFEPADAGGQSTIGAGGRYDGLIELLGGPHTSGVGFATGIERIMLNLEQRIAAGTLVLPPPYLQPRPDLYLAPLSGSAAGYALRAARLVREVGAAAVVGSAGRSLRAHFRAAEAAGASHIGIIGDQEVTRGTVQLKSLATDGEQEEVYLPSIGGHMRSALTRASARTMASGRDEWVTYYQDEDCLHLRLRAGEVADTEDIDDRIVDFDHEGRVIEVEFRNARFGVNFDGLPEADTLRDVLSRFPRLP